VSGTALGGVVEQVEQAAQFAVPADQPLTRYPQHIAIIPAGRGEGGVVRDYSGDRSRWMWLDRGKKP
jgi:hypothetical protein